MKKYLFDTNAISDSIARRHGIYDRSAEMRRNGAKIGTCYPVIAEMYFGIEKSASKQLNLIEFEIALRSFVIWPFDQKAAKEYGRIAAHLKRVGRPIQQIDMMIAAIALTIPDCTVVTRDTDFLAVPGLTVENWVINNACN